MARPTRSGNSVSLFPFLAVLMCTMGALIFLLIVTSRKLRTDAVERATLAAIPIDPSIVLGLDQSSPFEGLPDRTAGPAAADPNTELRSKVAALQRRRDELLGRRKGQKATLASAKARLDESESQKRAAERRLQELRAERLKQQQAEQELQRQHSALAGQLAKVEAEIRLAEQERSAAPSKFAIVPYDGRTGTSRRPIFIEFSGDGIRFLPEDILLTKSDLEGFTTNFNPLLAGARALDEYWTARSRASGGAEPLPYILMVVRPSGVELYPARQFLGPLNRMSGYELLEEDQKLALPPADPAAVAACRAAVERVLAERGHLLQELAAQKATERLGVRYRYGNGGFQPVASGTGSLAGRNGGLYEPSVRDQSGGAFTGTGTGSTSGAAFPEGPSGGSPSGNVAARQPGAGESTGQAGPPGGLPGTGGTGTSPGGPDGAPAGSAHMGSAGSPSSPHEPGMPSLDAAWYRNLMGRGGASRQQARKWGLSDPNATIGFERDVTIELHGERVIVGGAAAIPVPQDRADPVLVERVLIAIDDKVTTWGHPPANFYWVPSIRFLVHHGGDPLYAQINESLRAWGLSTRIEHPPAAAASAP